MAETTEEKWATYSDTMRKQLRTEVKKGASVVSFTGRSQLEALALFTSSSSPFDSAVYGEGDINQMPDCYVLSDDTIAHLTSRK